MPAAFTVFSRHAIERASQRCKITPERLAFLLDSGLTARVGHSRETNLVHQLLWSAEDDCFLVAIQEVVCGAILTVLTLEMYTRDYPDNVSPSRARRLINQMVHAGQAPAHMWQPGDSRDCVTVHAHTAAGDVVSLGGWRGGVSSVDLRELGQRREFWDWVLQRFQLRQRVVDELLRVEARFLGGENCEIPFAVA